MVAVAYQSAVHRRGVGAAGKPTSDTSPNENRLGKTEVEGNRTQFQNSFDDNNFGYDSETVRAKTYAFDTYSDSVASLRQRIQDTLNVTWVDFKRLEAAEDSPENRKAVETVRADLAILLKSFEAYCGTAQP